MTHQTDVPKDLSRDLCETLAAWRYDDLPAAVIEQIKLFVLDTLGVIGGAADAPGMNALHQRLGRWEHGGRCTSLLGGWQGSPPAAALAAPDADEARIGVEIVEVEPT